MHKTSLLRGKHLTPTRLSLAMAAGLMLASPAGHGAITVTGSYGTDPFYTGVLGGNRIDLPGVRLTVGSGLPGSFEMTAGATADLAGLNVGARAQGDVRLDGAATRLNLHGAGGRLEVGHNAALASMLVTNGAVLDARVDALACLGSIYGCYSYVGNSAGSDATFAVTAQARASFAGYFHVGGVHVDTPVGFGTPGASTTGRVNVLSGGELVTDAATLGVSNKSYWALGSEYSYAIARVEDAGSAWRVVGSSYDQGAAFLTLSAGSRSTSSLTVWNGGLLSIEAPAGRELGVWVGGGGLANLDIKAGTMRMSGDAQRGFINVGEGAGSTGSISVRDGGRVIGARSLQIGLNGGTGFVSIDGTGGSFLQMAAGHQINVGTGGKGRLEVFNAGALTAGQLSIGVTSQGQQGEGEVILSGGSTVVLDAVGTHRLSVGSWGVGALTLSGGATLDATGDAGACANQWCGAFVGQASGSTGRFTITGAGSKASLLGELNIAYGQLATPQADGWQIGTRGGTTRATVEVLDGGVLNAQRINVGGWQTLSGDFTERSYASVLVSGAGSAVNISGSALDNPDAWLNDATRLRATSSWQIEQGGRLSITAAPGGNATLRLGVGGESGMSVVGAGSRVALSGANVGVTVGASDVNWSGWADLYLSQGAALSAQASGDSWLDIGQLGATGNVAAYSGASITGFQRVSVGAGGAGSLYLSGQGSLLSLGGVGLLEIGRDSSGSFGLVSGAQALAQRMELGHNPGSTGSAVIARTDSQGVPATLSLGGSNMHRLYLGTGELVVTQGGVLDARANAAACPSGTWCGSMIGGNAGSNASFTVTGAGSRASFLSDFEVARGYLAVAAYDGWDEGTPGGMTIAQVQVLKGGLLETERVSVGVGSFSAGATGTESSIASLSIRGAGSTWRVDGGSTGAARFALVEPSAQGRALVTMDIREGGLLSVQAPAGQASYINVAAAAGQASVLVSGAGSAIEMGSDTLKALNIGTNGGNGSLSFTAGAQLKGGVNTLVVGNYGGQGRLSFDGLATGGTLGGQAYLSIGGRDSTGSVNILNGAVLATDATTRSSFLDVGRGTSTSRGQATLNISGTGSRLDMSVPDTPAGQVNPIAAVGRNADGTVNISGGGQLLMHGGLGPLNGNPRATSLEIGAGSLLPGSGTVNVSGAGSLLSVTGDFAVIRVGVQSLGSGRLAVTQDAMVRGTALRLGDAGGAGTVTVDHATLKLEAGAMQAPLLAVGAGGSGILQASNAASVDVGGGQALIGAGGTGVLRLTGGSSLVADYVGVGAASGQDTGLGTLIVNDSSSLTAATLEIGARGLVGGTGTINANVINRGVFSPGNSPGTLTINGSFVNEAGGRLVLEIESDGQGGFKTDELVFADGAAVDLGGLAISFHFLGATDPNAFQAQGGFKLESFFALQSGGTLPASQFASTSFSASADGYTISDFTFTPDGGATFSAAPVPEPGAWMLMMAGLSGVLFVARRRAAYRRPDASLR